jgi:four helix bundle protein
MFDNFVEKVIMKPHKKLNAWINSFEFVTEIYLATKAFPSEEKFGLVSQMRRAAVSVPVNIAEGSARKTPKEFIHFLHIALGSMTELDTLILLSVELEFIQKKDAEILLEKLDVIGKLIYGLIKNLESRLQ